MSASPSMRASSRIRASPAATSTSLAATPPFAPFATTTWWSAYAAICGRCVITSACRSPVLPRAPASAHFPADPLVHFVEHERGDGVVLRQHHLEREHEPRQLAPRGDFGERAGVEAEVQLNLEDDILRSLGAGRSEEHTSELQSRGHL